MKETGSFPKIAVLMSTYNGEAYLKEQIDSILGQKDVDVYLYIRDDGSTDRTKDIIQGYVNRVNVFFKEGKENYGPGKSFMYLLYAIGKTGDYQYYAFSDQDDIWLEEKLISAMGMLDNENVPQLYCSNQIIYEDGEEKGLRFKEWPDLTLAGHMTCNKLSGCTMLLNKLLVDEIVCHKCPKPDIINLRMHDAFVFLVALIIGEVKYDATSYILYRIHENNVVGVKGRNLFERVHRALKKGLPYKNLRMRTAQFLLSNYQINKEADKKIMEEFAYYQVSIKNRLKLMSDKQFCEISGENRWMFMVKTLINYV